MWDKNSSLICSRISEFDKQMVSSSVHLYTHFPICSPQALCYFTSFFFSLSCFCELDSPVELMYEGGDQSCCHLSVLCSFKGSECRLELAELSPIHLGRKIKGHKNSMIHVF